MKRLQVFNTEYIENINNAMAFVIESEYNLFGKEIVLEDGRITEVHTQQKVIREMPEVGDSVYIGYKFAGCLHNSPEGAPVPVLYVGEDMYNVTILPVVYPDKTIMFDKGGTDAHTGTDTSSQKPGG